MPPITVRPAPLPVEAIGHATTASFGDIDEQAAALRGWNQRYLQLSRGRFEGSVKRLQLDGVGLFIEDLHQSVHQTGWVRDDVFALGVPLLIEGDAQFCGQTASGHTLHVFSGEQGFEFRYPRRHAMIGIEMDRRLYETHLEATANEPGTLLHGHNAGLMQPDPAVMARLRNFLLDLFQNLSNPAEGTRLASRADLRRQVRGQLIDHIAAVLTPHDSAAPGVDSRASTAQTALVERAAECVDNCLAEPPSVGELCALLGVSRRTLQSAFHACWGMSPLVWLTTMRLNAVRRRLKSAASVTDAATEFGFWHFGHFAGHYQALFGECPSQTLRRHRQGGEH
ncbi:MAG TPA: helix-turn-helix domain-containing protein [Hydrogenophaga sp.]